MTPQEFAAAIIVLGAKYGGSVTSWGRTVARSKAVGGFGGDPHNFWLGCDMVYDSGPNKPDLDHAAHELGLKVLHEKNHDHFQPLDVVAGPQTHYHGTALKEFLEALCASTPQTTAPQARSTSWWGSLEWRI